MGNVLIQGGRLRKTNRGIISFAPFLAGASMLALGALLATASPAKAGSCDTTDTTTVERVCAGAVGTDRLGRTLMSSPASTEEGRAVYLSMDGQTNKATSIKFVDDNDPFGLNVANDAGFIITGNAASGSVGIILGGPGDITAGGSDTAPASGMATLNGDAIFIDHKGSGDITINAVANLQSMHGSGVQIRSEHASHTANTLVTISGNIGASGNNLANAVDKDGIYIFQNKAGSATVQVVGDIWAGRGTDSFKLDRSGFTTVDRMGRGIYIRQDNALGQNAKVVVRGSAGSSGAIESRGAGIHVQNNGIGETTVMAAGDIRTHGSGKGIYVRTHTRGIRSAKISAKSVFSNEDVGIDMYHTGAGEGRIEVSGSVTSGRFGGIRNRALMDRSGETVMAPNATHLSIKVGDEARRSTGAASADSVRSFTDGIVIEHQGGDSDEAMAVATADARLYVPVLATNTLSGTEATGIKITMGENTGRASIVQEDNIFADEPPTMKIMGVTVRVLAREEINAKTRGIDINQQGTGAIRIEASCSTDTVTATDTCITAADEEGIRVQTATKTTGAIDITVAGEADRGGSTGTNKAIKSGKAGIDVIHAGSGALTIMANGEIESGEAGIFVHNNYVSDTNTGDGTTGNIVITVGGEDTGTDRMINSQGPGIHLHQVGAGDATVTVNGRIESAAVPPTRPGHGVRINRDNGSGNATVRVNADITPTGGSAVDIHFIHDPSTSRTTTGDVSVTIAEGVTVTGDSNPAINVGNFGSGDTVVTINGTVERTGSSGVVLSVSPGGFGTLRLRLGDGANIVSENSDVNRDIVAIQSAGSTSTIELTGTSEDKRFDMGEISGFDNLEKTGSGTWTLAGAQDPGDAGDSNYALNQLIVSEGSLVLDLDPPDGSEIPILQFTGDDPIISIARGASLEINEDIFTAGGVALNLDGNLFLSEVEGGVDFSGGLVAGEGASVTVEVEFPEAMEETDETGETDETEEEERESFRRPRINTRTDGDVTAEEAIVVEIMPLSTGGPPVSMNNLIRVGGTASLGEETFVAGNIVDSPVLFSLEHEEIEGANVWNLVATQVTAAGGGGMGTIHDTFSATLSELSQPEMLYERLRDRQAKYGTNSWVKAYSANTQFTPEGSSFDIENAGFQIGLRAPMENILYQNWARNASFDASLEFGRAFSDALVASGTAEIHTETFAMGLGTTYNINKFYIDGQLKYSYFENSLNVETTRLASPGADSLAASIEFGSVLGGKGVSLGDIIGGVDAPGDPGIPNIELVPSLQVSWSSVDFGPYTSTTGIPVRLDDGDVFFGRVGMLAQGEWDNVHFLYDDFSVADVRLRGHVNFVAPLDAEVATEVMGMLITSKRVKPSLDAGIGIAYEWDDAYILHADITTQQGDEVEGYSGTIGFKHEF